MCGRFTLRTPANDWCQMFFPEMDPDSVADQGPRYNIAPTQQIICVVREARGKPLHAQSMRWGLVPPWAKELSIGNRMINARGETVDEKPSFRKPFASRRCAIIADGYYEWKKIGKTKQPFLIERSDHRPMMFAGLWEQNQSLSDDGRAIRSCTIITTNSNAQTESIHDRMPVMISPDDSRRWLDPGYRDQAELKSLLVPLAEQTLTLTEVSTHVNNARHEDAQCVKPIDRHESV